MECERINDFRVADLTPKKASRKKWKGHKLFTEEFFNLFICAKKKSGKTNLLFNVLKETTDANTTLFFFSSTIDKDATWMAIVKHFEKEGNPMQVATTIKDGTFDEMLEILAIPEVEEVESSEEDEEGSIIKLHTSKEKKKKKKKPPPPNYTIVLDDLSGETRSKEIAQLVKKNRHYRARIIISSQYPKDCDPQTLKQMDYVFLLANHSEDKLKYLHETLDQSIPFPLFQKAYSVSTAMPFSFLYVGRDEYRWNFDKRLTFEKKPEEK